MRSWISEKLEQLSSQKDTYECEIETLATSKKSKKKDQSGAAKWEELIERCRYHEDKLEVVLRLLDNETLSAEDVEPIKDQLDYLIELMVDGNLDELETVDDDGVYEELGLDDHDDSEETEAPPEKSTPVKEEKGRKGRGGKDDDDDDKKRDKKKEKASSADPVALPSINAALPKAVPKAAKDTKAGAKAAPTAAAAVPAVSSNARAGKAAAVPLTAAQPARGARGAA